MKKNNNWGIPGGMRDWLKGEAWDKRQLTNRLLEKMALWGYEEYSTPVLEYYNVLVKGESGQGPDHLYKLIDRDGSILALRPEMTTPLARVVSSKITGNPPWRLMYGAQVFRYEDIQAGRQREFGQVGVELIGQKGPEADGEILALAIESLLSLGLERFTVSLGHTGVLSGLLENIPCGEIDLSRARNLVLEKDFVGLQHLFEEAGMDKEEIEERVGILTRQISYQDLENCNPRLPQGIQKSFKELHNILDQVNNYGYSPFVQVDLSTLRSQTYYTGMVFEIYTSGLGYPIGGGGRYDKLLQHFGVSQPATGFALGVERLMLSLPGAMKREKPVLLAANKSSRKYREALLKKAGELRAQGKIVIAETRPLGKLQAEEIASEKGLELVWFQGEYNERISNDDSLTKRKTIRAQHRAVGPGRV